MGGRHDDDDVTIYERQLYTVEGIMDVHQCTHGIAQTDTKRSVACAWRMPLTHLLSIDEENKQRFTRCFQ